MTVDSRWQPIQAGTRFGRLVTTTDRIYGSEQVICRCDCGVEVTTRFAYLRAGDRRSCGCLRRESAAALKASHGMAGTKIYQIWADMVGRCTRATHPRYSSYGGRGITVCERWRDFANFHADMGERPAGLSLDRRDNNQGYSPDNCRWATASEQSKNRRRFGFESRGRDDLTGQFLPAKASAA